MKVLIANEYITLILDEQKYIEKNVTPQVLSNNNIQIYFDNIKTGTNKFISFLAPLINKTKLKEDAGY